MKIAAILSLAGAVILPADLLLARADTGLGPAPGNALNPAPINPPTAGNWMDDDGIGTRIPSARTPSGAHFNMPLEPGDEETDPKLDAWKWLGFFEAGGLSVTGDERAQLFRTYKDLKDGFYVNSFGVLGEKPREARFFEASGGALGRDDQFYRLQAGRYNDWRVTAWYDGTPQVTTTTYRSLWSGVGTGNLTLNGLAPGGTTNAATTQTNIQNALAATENSELQTVRKKAGLRFEKTYGDSWKLHAGITDEKRTGARPFGAVFGGGGGGGNLEVAESLDYHTTDVVAGAQYNDSCQSFNLTATASFFRNDIDTMTFQNPLFVTLNGSTGLNASSFTSGRFDLPPDNQHYNVKGEYARALPELWRGSMTATLAVGSMRQDDNLIAPTEFPLTGGTVTAGGASLANAWNTTDALSRQSAKARIDTALADVSLAFKPAAGLDVRGKLRYYETRNDMQYQSCNPLTGQWGRLLNDGSGLSLVTANTTAGANPAGTSANAFNTSMCDLAAAQALGLVPNSGNVPIRTAPYEQKQLNAGVTADYRLGRASSINGAIERESFRREYRERDETWEDKVKLGFVERGVIDGSIRVSYEHARRGGSDYDANPYEPFLSAGMGPLPSTSGINVQSWFHSIAQFRMFDLADRRQNVLNGRVDYQLPWNIDGAFTAQLKDATFPAQYGRTGHQRSETVTVDLSYQAGSTALVYANYTYQRGSMEQRGVHPNACTTGQTYYFYSDGRVLSAATGATPPATPDGTTLVGTQNVTGGNWFELCSTAGPASPLFPDSRGWDVESKDRNDVLGLGVKYDFGRVKLDTSFTRMLGRSQIAYAYNPAGLGLSPTAVALAGSGLSDITLAQNILNASAWVPITKNVMLRLLVRYETGKIRDWHYESLATNPMPASNAAYLDAGPQDYKTTVVGILFHVRL
ncbi:MAG TPA: MtrB/PioB family outer membrane beta-barrel protein [Usitatibacter sp.]|nr:MtrB/PioB family outer membrane beta-barrel protein [Usitatibacter sp.]